MFPLDGESEEDDRSPETDTQFSEQESQDSPPLAAPHGESPRGSDQKEDGDPSDQEVDLLAITNKPDGVDAIDSAKGRTLQEEEPSRAKTSKRSTKEASQVFDGLPQPEAIASSSPGAQEVSETIRSEDSFATESVEVQKRP